MGNGLQLLCPLIKKNNETTTGTIELRRLINENINKGWVNCIKFITIYPKVVVITFNVLPRKTNLNFWEAIKTEILRF